MAKNKIRVAVLVDEDRSIPAWQYLMLERLSESNRQVYLSLLLTKTACSINKINMFIKGLWELVLWTDQLLFKEKPRASYRRSLPASLKKLPCYSLNEKGIRQCLAQFNLDLIIDLTSGLTPQLNSWLPKVTKLGVWKHFFSQYSLYSAEKNVAIREFLYRDTEIFSGLLCYQSHREQPLCLFYATTSTHPISLNRSTEACLWKSAAFIPERLKSLVLMGELCFYNYAKERYHACFQQLNIKKINFTPDLFFLIKIISVYIKALAFKLSCRVGVKSKKSTDWILLLDLNNSEKNINILPSEMEKILPPDDRLWADPFLFEINNECYIFFEELIYKEKKGHISFLKVEWIGNSFKLSEPKLAIKKTYHLSYPHLFLYQGFTYMVPETAENKSIELYRCDEFPGKWSFVKKLMYGVEAYDSTLFEYNKTWWLLTSMRQHEKCYPNESLYLFYADSPLSDSWQAHPENPVISEASKARPAGAVFWQDGKLYRPSQDCAGAYGRRVNINEIRVLNKKHYREKTVEVLDTEHCDDLSATHTFNFNNKYVVMDGILQGECSRSFK